MPLTPKERQLDRDDSAAYMLTGATIVGAFRRREDPKDLFIAGLTDNGDGFIIQITATVVTDGDGDRVARLVSIPTCDTKAIERLALELKKDVEAAEAQPPTYQKTRR